MRVNKGRLSIYLKEVNWANYAVKMNNLFK